jgi:hypothetical protein
MTGKHVPGPLHTKYYKYNGYVEESHLFSAPTKHSKGNIML